MDSPANVGEIKQQLAEELEGTQYACSDLAPLSGGSANFIFRGTLKQNLPDGTNEVVIKHGEGYVASNQNFQLPTSRCRFEEDCLQEVARLAPATNTVCAVRTPKLFLFNPTTNTQVQECLPNAVDLKNYALRHYSSPTPESLEVQCHEIGRGLGTWLRNFHSWVKLPEQASLREEIKLNGAMQALKNMINYSWLIDRINQFPSTLEDARGILEDVQKMTKAELEDENKLQIIHGDFWTGNALLPNGPIKDGEQVPIFVIDWELCQFGVKNLDLGQMIAEMYELSLFKNIQAGVWMVQGFASGYGVLDDDFAFRTAIHVGTHLICFGSSAPGWGTPEQVQGVVEIGRDIIIKAWQKDRAWFAGHPLECLFGSI